MTLTTTKKILIFLIVLSFLLPIPQLANEVSAQGRLDADYDLGSEFTVENSSGGVFANALTGFLSPLASLLLRVFFTILVGIIGIFVFLATAIISFILLLFDNAITALIAVPVIQAPVVMDMWVFVRDFANVFFILAFVVIGLATILKIESYKFQKTLPLLIIMALLMNFSLILVGFIVDIGNILTSLFLEGVQGRGNDWSVFLSFGSAFLTGIGDFWQKTDGVGDIFTIGLGYTSYGITLLAFYALATVIFGTIIFIFILRIAILWILAILSPLAFISYIFASTRKMIWDRWLKNLIQWSIIAAPILFFLFLGFATLQLAPDSISGLVTDMGYSPATVGDMTDPGSSPLVRDFGEVIGSVLAAIITPIIALVMILIGILISMSLVPEGADKAISAAKSSGSAVFQGARKTAPVAAAERKIRKRLEGTRFGRAIVGERGTYDRETLSLLSKEELKGLSALSREELIAAAEDKSLDRVSMNAKTATAFKLLHEKGGVPDDLYKKHIDRAVRGGLDRDLIDQENPVHRIKDPDKFTEVTNKMTKPSHFTGLRPESFKINTKATPAEQTIQQERMIVLLEKLTRLSQQGIRKASEDIDPATRIELKKFMTLPNTRPQVEKLGRAAERQPLDIKQSLNNLDTQF